jgi:hypothetical protein
VKPVKQTIFAGPGVRGDCFRACVASVLELAIEDVPHFVAMNDWWGELQKWLSPSGMSAFQLRLPPDELVMSMPAEDLFCILSGPSPRGNGLWHCVVGQVVNGWNFATVHDPHPSNDGLIGPAKSALFFIPLHPQAL